VDPDVGPAQHVDLGPDPAGGAPRQGDHQVGGPDALDPVGEAVDLAQHSDRIGLGMDGQLPAPLAARISGVAGIDEPDHGVAGPRPFAETSGDSPAGAAVSDDQEATPRSEVGARRGIVWGYHHRTPPIHRCRGGRGPHWVARPVLVG
jgi:hypothetical protein